MRASRALCIVVSLLFAAPLSADTTVLTGEAVAEQANAALRSAGMASRVAVSANRMFPGCAAPLRIQLPSAGGKRVGVTCPTTGWRREFRTEPLSPGTPGTAVGGPAAVLILRESLARGTILQPHHLEHGGGGGDLRAGALSDLERALGRTLRVNLGRGQTLLARHLEQSWYVSEGVPVTLSLSRSGIAIEVSGIPQSSGQLGEVVDVLNTSSGQILRAEVTGKNFVTVGANIARIATVSSCASPESGCGKD
ncbi:MAG: flagellar basal body P-ring formation chaperone FlgA [Pseudomonadota bacterium]